MGQRGKGKIALNRNRPARALRLIERKRDKLVGELEAAGADVEALTRVGTDLAALEAQLGAAEQRWLDLAEALESAR